MLLLHLFGLLFSLFRLTSAPPADPATDDPPAERTRATDVLARYGSDVVRMAEKVAELESDLYRTRRSRDDYKRDNDELKKKAAPDGATVLSAADAERWQAYTALGKPDELKTRLEEGAGAVTERDTLKKRDTLRQVAEAAGYKPAVLERLGSDLTYEIKDTTEMVNGRQAQTKQVLVQDGDKQTPLKDYAAREWGDFLPALGGTEQAPAYGTPRRDPAASGMGPSEKPGPIPGIRL